MSQRKYRSFLIDSTYWDDYRPRSGDVVICSQPKSGSTWTQRIVSVLVFNDPRLPDQLGRISPWLESRFTPVEQKLKTLEEQRHRRFIKTHLPMDALPVHPEVCYIVVGRDPRDTAVSAHNHTFGLYQQFLMDRKDPPLPPPTGDDVHLPELPAIPGDIREFWRLYFTRGAFPWETNGWPIISPTRFAETWWPHRSAPNILFLHYQDMLRDLDGEMRRVADFLGIAVDEARWPELVNACTFSEMKKSSEHAPHGAAGNGARFEFFHKGRNRQWERFATEEDLGLYRAAMDPLDADLREWLARSE
jgi:aryl sulfotransferase